MQRLEIEALQIRTNLSTSIPPINMLDHHMYLEVCSLQDHGQNCDQVHMQLPKRLASELLRDKDLRFGRACHAPGLTMITHMQMSWQQV